MKRLIAFVSYHHDIFIALGFLALILGTIGFMYSLGRT